MQDETRAAQRRRGCRRGTGPRLRPASSCPSHSPVHELLDAPGRKRRQVRARRPRQCRQDAVRRARPGQGAGRVGPPDRGGNVGLASLGFCGRLFPALSRAQTDLPRMAPEDRCHWSEARKLAVSWNARLSLGSWASREKCFLGSSAECLSHSTVTNTLLAHSESSKKQATMTVRHGECAKNQKCILFT